MKRLVAVFLSGLVVLPAPALAFDNSTCKQFLVGTWNGKNTVKQKGVKVKIKMHAVYAADGTFSGTMSMEIPNAPPQPLALAGTWDAGPGPQPDTCNASITTAEQGLQQATLTIVDDNNVVSPDGMMMEREVE